MLNRHRIRIAAVATALAVTMLAACAPTETNIRPRLDEDTLPRPVVRGMVAVTATQPSRPRLFTTDSVVLDHRQLADAAAELLQMTVDRQPANDGDEKQIDITITSVDCLTFHCWVSVTVECGDGTFRGVTAEGDAYSIAGAVRKAIETLPGIVFDDPSIRDYIAG